MAEVKRKTNGISRRRFIKRTAAGFLAAAGVYSLGASRVLRLTRLRIEIPRLPAGLDGLKIAYAADFHLGDWFPVEKVRAAVKKISALGADLILLGGDYVTSPSADFDTALAEISRLAAPHGVWAVPGNHDCLRGSAPLREAMAQTSISDLTNRGVAIGGGEPLWIAGLDDLWRGYPDFEKAMKGAPEGAPVIVLCHNPYTAEEIPAGSADLILAGHTHGWQVYVPLVTRFLIPSNMSKYRAGFYRTAAGLMYVTRGVGLSLSRLRLWCPPEVVLIELRRRDAGH